MYDRTDIEKIRHTLSTAGWIEVMRPALEQRARNHIKKLVLTPAERPEGDRDDATLRGAIKELEWMLVAWTNEVAVADHNRRLEELEAAGEPEMATLGPDGRTPIG